MKLQRRCQRYSSYGNPRGKAGYGRDRHLEIRTVCVAYVVDKYTHAELATLIHICMFLHWKCKSQLHHLLKRHVIMCLEICNFVRRGLEWERGKVKAVPIVKDRLWQLGAQREGKENNNFTTKCTKIKIHHDPFPAGSRCTEAVTALKQTTPCPWPMCQGS